METLLVPANAFLMWLWRASWQASAMIVLVLVAQVLLSKQLTPPWRHVLWFLVVIRLALPWSVESRLSLFTWFPGGSASSAAGSTQAVQEPIPNSDEQSTSASSSSRSMLVASSPWIGLGVLWGAGVLGMVSYVVVTTWRLGWKIRRRRPITDGAVLNLLEDCKQAMGVHTPLCLVETDVVTSPSLFGFVRPRLLLPIGLVRSFSHKELRYVFLHELSHLKRRDIPMNWATTVPLILHWFNPLVWYAFSRMRVDCEIACDALALSHTPEVESQSYGRTIIKLLETFSRPAVVPGLVGLLENNHQMKRRISMIAKFKKTNRWPLAAASLLGALALVTLTDAQPGQGLKQAGGSAAETGPVDLQAPPTIVATSPAVGETEVDPALMEITVTFDHDMQGGFSWTGGGPEFPPSPEGAKAKWRNKRTCVLPVKLSKGHFYRVGINSTSYQNFRSVNGVPARPSAIYFTTQGASETLKRSTAKPRIIGLVPLNGAKDVDPKLTELRITFSVPMGGGFSWTGGGPQFPDCPPGKKPYWTEDHETCVLPVELKPGWEYHLGLNSPSHKNFQSVGGVPLDPVSYTFRTRE
jgi:beta-lactamase regulating signal transducer with metallopeptidase domain